MANGEIRGVDQQGLGTDKKALEFSLVDELTKRRDYHMKSMEILNRLLDKIRRDPDLAHIIQEAQRDL